MICDFVSVLLLCVSEWVAEEIMVGEMIVVDGEASRWVLPVWSLDGVGDTLVYM